MSEAIPWVVPYTAQRTMPMMSVIRKVRGDAPLVGAEIGVLRGDGALCILENLNMRILYLIDPYEPYEEYPERYSQELHDQCKQMALDKLDCYEDRVRWIFKKSVDALPYVEEPLDFVYIDANHTYEYVKQDIANYFPLVKPDGYVGGHDFSLEHSEDAVTKAVSEFAVKRACMLFVTPNYHCMDFPEWWFPKCTCGELS